MSNRTPATALLVAAFLFGGAAPGSGEKPEPGEKSQAAAITASLEKRIKGKVSLDDVSVDLVWEQQRAHVFGTGAVIWDQAMQCRIPRADVISVLKAINAAGFGSMETRIGSEEESGKPGRLEESETRGTLTVAVGPLSKMVLQMRAGEQSKGLASLAHTILGVSAPCEKSGVHPANLAEGLAEISDGKLAPEALKILAQRRIDRPAPGDQEGWYLEMTGPLALSRVLPKTGAPENSRWLRLSSKEMMELVAFLRDNDPMGMPQSLYAPQYTDVRVRILHTNRYINARPFAGMTPTTHGAKQESFDRVYARLRDLARRIRKDGKPLTELMPTAETEERDKEGAKKD